MNACKARWRKKPQSFSAFCLIQALSVHGISNKLVLAWRRHGGWVGSSPFPERFISATQHLQFSLFVSLFAGATFRQKATPRNTRHHTDSPKQDRENSEEVRDTRKPLNCCQKREKASHGRPAVDISFSRSESAKLVHLKH